MKKFVLFFSAVLVSGTLLAQNRVSGTVTGSEGDPLGGVIVALQNTRTVTTTDGDGNYSVDAPSDGTLEFSLLGMTTQVVAIDGRGIVNVTMTADAQTILTVSVYGTSVSQHAISGSVASLSSDAVTSTVATSFDQALSGKIAGVQINSASGLLADGTSIRIRGTNSISNSSQPLVVVDGVPMTETSNLNVFNSGNGTRFNPMATINQNDIANIEVLNDAAAAALYGSRAANGVILITTKRGTAGRVQVSYNNYFSWSKGANLPSLLNADQFVEIQNEAAANWWGEGTRIAELMTDSQGNKVETDWMKKIYRTGFSQNHSMSISGGTEKLNFYGSADWLDQEGITIGNALNRYAFRATVDATPTKWFKAGISLNYSKTHNKGVLSDGYLAGVTVMGYLALPNVPEKNDDGTWALDAYGRLSPGKNLSSYGGVATFGNSINHPTATIALQRNANTSDRIGAIAYATVTPLKGLSATTKLGLDNLSNFEDQYAHPDINGLGRSMNGLVQNNYAWIRQWNWQNYINYSVTIADNHHLGAMVGLEYQERHYKDLYGAGYNYVSPDVTHLLDNLFTEKIAGGTMDSRGFASAFGNVNYNFKSKYYFDAYFRRDGYSGLGLNNQYGFFPGFSAAWRVGSESFMASTRNWLSDLKLRTSWGVVGNSDVKSYASRDLYSGGLYAYVNGISMSQVGNNNLAWEQSQKFDVGLDASFLNGRIDVAFDYWRSDMSDMLLNAEVPFTTGIPKAKVMTNLGRMSNSGIELQINTENIVTANREFVWSSSFNFTTVNNKVKKLFKEMEGTNYIVEGKPLGVWWVYEWAGVDPETGRPGYIDQPTGLVKYYDATPGVDAAQRWKFADGTAAKALNTSDNIFIDGYNGTPKWYGNLDNTFNYKNFDLTVGLQFAGGFKILNATRAGLMATHMGNKSTEVLGRWTKKGDRTDVPRLVWGQNTGLTTVQSTRFLEDGDYLRMRELTLGYTLPDAVSEKLGFTGRIYVRANNLFILTGYTGSDPEISTNRNSTGNGNHNAGWDNRSVPAVRSYTVGLNLNF
jgi:TonB-linked SusC/RagA family outer membrane protein